MPYDQKSRKEKNINHNLVKQLQAKTVDLATHLTEAQHMQRDAGNVVR